MKVLPWPCLPCKWLDLRVARMTTYTNGGPFSSRRCKKSCPQLVLSCLIHWHSNRVHWLIDWLIDWFKISKLLTSPLASQDPQPRPASLVLTAWSLGLGETKMAPHNGAHVNDVQLQIEKCAKILQERSLVFHISGLLTSGSFNCDKKKVLYFEHKPQSMTSKWSCTGWRIFFKVQVGCNGLSLQGNFRAVEAT